MALVAIPVILGIYAAWWIGSRFGWGYHVLIFVLLGAFISFMLRLALGKRLQKKFDRSAFGDSPESQALAEQVAALHADAYRLDEKLRLDVFVIPGLLFVPSIIALCLLRQTAYAEEHRLWSGIGPALLLPYFMLRYLLPRKRPNQAPQRNAGSRPLSGDSSASETPSSLGPRG